MLFDFIADLDRLQHTDIVVRYTMTRLFCSTLFMTESHIERKQNGARCSSMHEISTPTDAKDIKPVAPEITDSLPQEIPDATNFHKTTFPADQASSPGQSSGLALSATTQPSLDFHHAAVKPFDELMFMRPPFSTGALRRLISLSRSTIS